eukprot:359692-Chlamydomonas_euryale.AAC.1
MPRFATTLHALLGNDLACPALHRPCMPYLATTLHAPLCNDLACPALHRPCMPWWQVARHAPAQPTLLLSPNAFEGRRQQATKAAPRTRAPHSLSDCLSNKIAAVPVRGSQSTTRQP